MLFESATASDSHACLPEVTGSELAQACCTLWLATLSLMTAFMHTPAPAHRCLLARRISRNLATLADQPEVFGDDNCLRFQQLGKHWGVQAERYAANQEASSRSRGLLQTLAIHPGGKTRAKRAA